MAKPMREAKGQHRVALWLLFTAPQVLPHAAHGLFTGEQWRFRRDNLVGGTAVRLLAGAAAVPRGGQGHFFIWNQVGDLIIWSAAGAATLTPADVWIDQR